MSDHSYRQSSSLLGDRASTHSALLLINLVIFVFEKKTLIFERCRYLLNIDKSNKTFNLSTTCHFLGMFEDSYAMHLRALTVLTKLNGESSLSVARVKSSITHDLLRLFQFEKAMVSAVETLSLLNRCSDKEVEDLSNLYVIIAYIYIGKLCVIFVHVLIVCVSYRVL
jgi:hypothetical protein